MVTKMIASKICRSKLLSSVPESWKNTILMISDRISLPIIPGASIAGIRIGMEEKVLPPGATIDSLPDYPTPTKMYAYNGYTVIVEEEVVTRVEAEIDYRGEVAENGLHAGMSWIDAKECTDLVFDSEEYAWAATNSDGLYVQVATPLDSYPLHKREEIKGQAFTIHGKYYLGQIWKVKGKEDAIVSSIYVK